MRPRILPIVLSFGLTVAAIAAEPVVTLAKANPQGKPVDAATMTTTKGGDLTPEQTAFFESKVRPILSETCYKCHSVEAGKSKGGLLLDTREGWEKGGDSGSAIKPGDPTNSLIIKAISYNDADLQMPPKGEKLKADQIAALTEWVKMGAPDPRKSTAKAGKLSGLTDKARQHWAFQPIKTPPVPEVKNKAWCQTPVDAFILAKLDEKGMMPNYDTQRETLLRRAYFDLIGLPPSPKEIEEFANDKSTDAVAFAKVVERLLASPQYGERWGRFWLDTARYADTIGGNRNANNRRLDYRFPFAWTYRDWVIKAFNQDMPYDKFIIAQLAADRMPEAKVDKTLYAGMGFITVGERFTNPNDVINDRIDVVGKGFLGLTVACARCHDHMFDPIPTKDYYALHGVFASIEEPSDQESKPLINNPDPSQRSDFDKKIAVLEKENRNSYYRVLGEYLEMFRKNAGVYLLAADKSRGKTSESDQVQRAELIKKYDLEVEIFRGLDRNSRREGAVFGPWRAFAELSMGDYPTQAEALAKEIAENKSAKYNPTVAAAFKGLKPKSQDDIVEVYNSVFKNLDGRGKELLKVAAESKDGKFGKFDDATVQLLSAPYEIEPANKLDTRGIHAVTDNWPLRMGGRAKFVFAAINELYLTHPGAPARAMIVEDKSSPQNSAVFLRGQPETRGDTVPRHFLEILSPGGKPKPFDANSSGRYDLAKCIASKDNPLTARVMVNRMWLHHFGEGFVRTPDDLGTQSEKPTHPELVDYLSSYFMDHGWSIKAMHRLIMNSRVYRISSSTKGSNEAYQQLDPENRLLWRANFRRLDFESMRDSLLAFAGKLDTTMGGHPVNLTDEPYSHRRSVYGYIDRGNLPELMQSFDFSDPDMPNSKRSTTIVPQQALFLMNSSMSVDAARRVVARPEVANARDGLAAIYAIYHIIFQRYPNPDEIKIGLEFVKKEVNSDAFISDAQKRAAKASAKEKEQEIQKRMEEKANMGREMYRTLRNEGEIVDRRPLTPWETYAQALLLSNEAAYVN